MKRYEGTRKGEAVCVTVDGKPLDPRLDLQNHSPTGLEWGYGGSGPAQLALALLADYFGDDEEALALHQLFKCTVIAGLPRVGWTLTAEEIQKSLIALESQ